MTADEQRRGPGRPSTEQHPCGTWQAARRHKRHGEQLDEPCAEALRKYNADAALASRARKRGDS